jgi:glycosyltransferase involved in cell wall biosynthesis
MSTNGKPFASDAPLVGSAQHPLVSVITIFLNGERYIREAIESVFAQTYENWELLLVDDGSTDGSTAIAAEYAARFPQKVHLLEHPGHENRGMSASRNRGICQAKGAFIALLDADDAWLHRKLEAQVAQLIGHPEAAMAYSGCEWWNSWLEVDGKRPPDSLRPVGVTPNRLYHPPELLIGFMRQDFTTPVPSSLMIRREAAEELGGFEETFRTVNEDEVFITKICLNKPIFVGDGCYTRYRQHSQSCIAETDKNKMRTYHLKLLDWQERYFTGRVPKNGPHLEIWRLLYKQLRPYRHPVLHKLVVDAQHLLHRTRWLPSEVAEKVLPMGVHQWLRQQLGKPPLDRTRGS